MDLVIWKTTLELTDIQEINVPAEAQLLFVREQFGKICIWFRCNPSKPTIRRKIVIVGTGHKITNEKDIYIGSASLEGGLYIWHVFERA